MELWIRSQDKKELIKTNRIYQYSNIVYTEAEETIELGTYKSKERALEVLDEIQQILCPKKPKSIIGKNVEFIPSIVYVYEMPKD